MFKDISSKLPEALISYILTKESILNIEVFIAIYQVLYPLQVNIDVLRILDSLIVTLIMFYYTGILKQYRGYCYGCDCMPNKLGIGSRSALGLCLISQASVEQSQALRRTRLPGLGLARVGQTHCVQFIVSHAPQEPSSFFSFVSS